MKEWLARHLVLNREERLLVSAILLLFLCGLGVTLCRRSAPAEAENPMSDAASEPSPAANTH